MAYSGIYDVNYCVMIWDACPNLLWRDTSYVCTLVSIYRVSPVSLAWAAGEDAYAAY